MLRPRRLSTLTAELGRGDYLAFAWTALFFGWLVFDWFGPAWATAIDLVLFAPLGLAVGVLQLQVASRVEDRRERAAWRLLAAAAFSRFVSGSVWGIAVAVTGGGESPPWMIALACAYLVFGIAGLLVFPGVRWRPVDLIRFRIDGAIVILGSLLVVWFFALGPFFRSTGESAALFQDYVYTIGDSITVVLAAALYLRCDTRMMRTVSVLLLFAYTLQVIPDIVLYSGTGLYSYKAGDAIAGVWYAVWALKWLAARYASAQVRRPEAESRRRIDEYRSGVMPHVFLCAAVLVLLHHLLTGNRLDSALFVVGSGSLAALLVARQAVEVRERDRLHELQLAEENWYRALLHHAYDFVVLLDGEGRATYVSPATSRLLGDAGALSKAWGVVDVAHPDDAPRLRAALAGPARREASVTLACRMRDAAGSWRELSLRLHDLTADPLVGAVVVNGHDQTREASLSQRLRESRDVEALGIFAGGLAHDLNNILTVIGSHVELLQSEPFAHSQAAADLRAIRAATSRAATLTRGLLALSRRKTAPRRSVDVAALVRERLDAQRSTREWPVTLIGEPRIVHADPLSLGQVVDSVLNTVAVERRDGALRMATHVVDANDATALDIEPGTYIVLEVGVGAHAGNVSEARTPPTGADWDSSPDELGMLMALTAVREAGGTLTIEGRGEDRRVAVYLPSAAA